MAECIEIIIRFDDGTVRRTEDCNQAQGIWGWWNSCETLARVHGASYKGKPLLAVTPQGCPASQEA